MGTSNKNMFSTATSKIIVLAFFLTRTTICGEADIVEEDVTTEKENLFLPGASGDQKESEENGELAVAGDEKEEQAKKDVKAGIYRKENLPGAFGDQKESNKDEELSPVEDDIEDVISDINEKNTKGKTDEELSEVEDETEKQSMNGIKDVSNKSAPLREKPVRTFYYTTARTITRVINNNLNTPSKIKNTVEKAKGEKEKEEVRNNSNPTFSNSKNDLSTKVTIQEPKNLPNVQKTAIQPKDASKKQKSDEIFNPNLLKLIQDRNLLGTALKDANPENLKILLTLPQ